MTHFLFWFFLLIAGWPQGTQQNIGTKLVQRYPSGTFAGGEMTTYTMDDRRRREFRNTSQHRNADGSWQQGDPSINVVIQRCDLGKVFEIDTKAKEYKTKEYPPKPLTPEERTAHGLDDPDWDTSTLPAFRVETTTVDTGEREEFFGQRARHVVITVKRIPLGDTKGEPSVSVRSGWYIDYDREISCEPRSSAGSKIHDFGWVQVKTYRILTEKIENFQVGDREAGLLVKSDSEDSGTSTLKGSNGVNLSVPNRMQITEFFRGPLDSALFELPTEFQLKF